MNRPNKLTRALTWPFRMVAVLLRAIWQLFLALTSILTLAGAGPFLFYVGFVMFFVALSLRKGWEEAAATSLRGAQRAAERKGLGGDDASI